MPHRVRGTTFMGLMVRDAAEFIRWPLLTMRGNTLHIRKATAGKISGRRW